MPAETAFERHLIRQGLVTDDEMTRLHGETSGDATRLVEALIAGKHADDETAYRSLAEFAELRYVTPSKMEIPPEVVDKVPPRFATHYDFVPIQERNGAIVVAVNDPLNAQLLDDIRLVLKQRIEPAVATPDEIQRALKRLYGVGAETVERILSDSDSSGRVVHLDGSEGGSNLGDENIDASIIKFVNELLAEAIQTEATDVHMEPFEDQLRVRYRIDGVLHAVPTPGAIRGLHSAIVSRIKIMANLNIAEKRLPQDGKIRASLGDEQFDLRVSILPTPHGETVNLRILNRASMFLPLEELGFQAQDLEQFNAFIQRPHGMILLTGPTGSGKTTTLYGALNKLNRLESKIITIEDPIEYQLKGISQMQVQPSIGFGFSEALRSMLRHDPDIMLVGEVRDFETAEMAIRSSLTGHLVFSTLHTNDAAGAVTRLTDMGVEPFLIASTMVASIAQRLVRRLCPKCAEVYSPEADEFTQLGLTPDEVPADAEFRRARGCDACRNTGYRGRSAIYEILPFTDAIKRLTVQRRPSTEIKHLARELGMRTLREAAWERVCQGRTTFEEAVRVTVESDEMSVDAADPAPPEDNATVSV
ncbi:MAG: type II/IV secretion system protein [bacterium]|nr:type II/IV secretion system protein [bacterium]